MEISLTYLQINANELQKLFEDISLLPELRTNNLPELQLGYDAEIIYYLLTGETKKINSILSKALLGQNILKSDYWDEPFLGLVYYITPDEIEETLKKLSEVSSSEFEYRINSDISSYKKLFPKFGYKNIEIARNRLTDKYSQMIDFFQVAKNNSKIIILGIE